MKSGKTASTARSCSRRVPPRKLTAAAWARRGREGVSVRSRVLGLNQPATKQADRRAPQRSLAGQVAPGSFRPRSRRTERETRRRTPHAPGESGGADREADPEHLDEDGDEGGEVEREDAVPEDAQRLEERAAERGRVVSTPTTTCSRACPARSGWGSRERKARDAHFAAEELGVERDDDRAGPDDDEDAGEDRERLVGRGCAGGAHRAARRARSVSLTQLARRRVSPRTVGRQEDGERQAELQGEVLGQCVLVNV